MACMMFHCTECSWVGGGNNLGPSSCPDCGAKITRHFDEDPGGHVEVDPRQLERMIYGRNFDD